MSFRGAGTAAAVGVAAVISLPIFAACTPPPQNCGSVGFAPNTDWGAFHIQATNTSCSTARGIASGSKYARGSYSGFGWRCVAGRTDYTGLPFTPYRCTSWTGAGVVTFQYS